MSQARYIEFCNEGNNLPKLPINRKSTKKNKKVSIDIHLQQATDGAQASENWGLLMEICDIINETEDGPKDAMRAIKKKLNLNVGKNFTVVMYTLTVLETCVKNCGKRFHVQIASKDFMAELVKVIGPKNDPPQVVQEKVLSLIQTWADAFSGVPDLKEVCKVYMDLKNKGIEFPMTDLDAMAPIHTPARTSSEPEPALQVSRSPQRTAAPVPQQPPPHATVVPVPPHMAAPQPRQQYPQQQVLPAGPVLLQAEQLAKLKSELDVVQQNCKLLSEMLTELTPGSEEPSDLELLQDLNRTCRQMQQRIVEMIDKVQNEDVTCELLRVNDELNNVFLRYDRFERLRGSQTQQQQQQQQQQAAIPPAVPVRQAAPAPAVAATTSPTGEPATANLIDLATPDPTNAQTQNPFPPAAAATDDVHLRLAGLSVGGNTVSNQLDNLSTTTATTGQAGPDDDFDMFAQSRQSFDQNKQQIGSGTAYSSQVGDVHQGGLNNAVTSKNTGTAGFGQDKNSEYDEMETWLKENPQEMQPAESATSSEFDRFLAERAREADTLPDIDAATGAAGAGQRTNPRRQIQKDDGDNALFAL